MAKSNSTENWLPVVGYEGLYEVSDFGRVRSLDRITVALNRWGSRAPRRYKGRVFRPSLMKGYPHVHLSRNGQIARFAVHRLVLEAFVEPCPEGMECRHFPDRDRANCSLDNLSWGTRVENFADKHIHGTDGCGERNSQAKFSVADIQRIFRLRKSGVSTKSIMSMTGISRTHVNNILAGRRWAHTGHYASSLI